VPASDDFNRGDNEGVGYFEVNQKRGWRWNTARAFLRPACTRRSNFTLWTQATAQRLELERQGDGALRCRGVEVRKDGGLQYVYLDPDYFLEIRVESQRVVRGVKRTSVTDYGNYEKVGGVFWPLSIESGTKGGGEPDKYEYQSAVVNPEIAPDYFAFPAAAQK